MHIAVIRPAALAKMLPNPIPHLHLPMCNALAFSDNADMKQLASLSRLTHLDLGSTDGVAALAPQLPSLQSLALHLRHIHPSVRTYAVGCRNQYSITH